MLTVYKFHLSKADLAAIPEDERALIFLSGHALNLLGVWIKVLRLATNHPEDGTLEHQLSDAQSQIVLRALCGVLVEAWEWLRRPESQRLIGTKFLPMMEQAPRDSYDELKRYFGSSGLLHQLRNQAAYHFPKTDDLDAAFARADEAEDWSWYPSDTHVNSFYWSCEMVVGYGTIGLTGEANGSDGLARIAQDAVKVANGLGEFLTGLLAAAIRSNIPVKPTQSVALEVADPPDASKFRLPFFTQKL